MVMLMLVPLASGTTLLWPDEIEPIGSEHLLVLEEGVWTSQQWASLTEQGIQPLRTVDPQTLLVWGDMKDVTLPADFTIQKAPPAEYKPGLAPSNGPEEFRVLLEPRLPDRGVDNVQQALEAFGFPVLSSSLDVRGNIPASLTVLASDVSDLNPLLQTDGVLWVEPVLSTRARNGQASAMIESGELGHHPFWELGLNASGIVLGVADSGIDADHACFRNATTPTSVHAEGDAVYPAVGVFNEDHRKILHLNTSVDGNDTPGHSDYRHGTHVIGSLACHDVFSARQGHMPNNGSSLAYGSSLVIQDIVSADGWSPPDVDRLLWETSAYGGVVHSDSWGDDTTAYTQRTGLFDAYAKAMPWSLAVIAPGNSGEGVLEPANGRNVVAVGASTKDVNEGRWGSSAYGPTESGTDGIFLLAPGSNIQSAGADGFWDTNNANLRLSSGTSMATPLAAGAAGVVQQLYEDGWIVPAHAATEPHNMSALQPTWAEAPPVQSIELGEGFTPSGSLLRASLAMATSPLPQSVRSGGEGGYELHNPYDGWGMLNLSELLNPALLVDGQSPSEDLWIHDSYRLKSGTVHEWFSANKGAEGNLSGMLTSSWSGDGSVGPFLQTGDLFTQRFVPLAEQDVRIRLAFPAQPEPAMVDDIQLRVRLEDGTILLPDRLQEGDYAPTQFYPSATDTNDTAAFPSSNETVVGLDIPWHYLNGSSHVDIDVIARFVQPGNAQGSVGLDGDAVGFALVVKGVERDSSQAYDSDGDGVADSEEIAGCTNFLANNYNPEATDDDGSCDWDLDDDGIWDIDDRDMDGDGVLNIDEVDGCTNALANNYNAAATDDDGSCDFDLDNDGILDVDDTDMDGDGVLNDNDLCPIENVRWPRVDDDGDGCLDEISDDWRVEIRYNGGCTNCYARLMAVRLSVDNASVHQSSISPTTGNGLDWTKVLSKYDGFDKENFEEVKLQAQVEFVHSYDYTSGRQDMCWYFGTCYSYSYPTVSWSLDVEFVTPHAVFRDDRTVTISSSDYSMNGQNNEHTFTWSKEPIVDIDEDGYTVPGVEYSGVCGVDVPHSYYQPGRGLDYPCDLYRNNVFDEFPHNPTQWVDADGDGFGDNVSGADGDAFPNNPGQWSDVDGDGFGDNPTSSGWDDCINQEGTSFQNLNGCPDADGDGFSDVCGDDWCGTASAWGPNGYYRGRLDTTDNCPETPGTSYETRYGCPDTDGDGWADPMVGDLWGIEDACPEEYGKAISERWRGCPDRDGDGWADVEDDLPDDPDYHLDSDGDGVADEEDDFPNNALLSDDDQAGGLFFSGCGLVFMVVVFLVTRNKLPPEPKTFDVGRF